MLELRHQLLKLLGQPSKEEKLKLYDQYNPEFVEEQIRKLTTRQKIINYITLFYIGFGLFWVCWYLYKEWTNTNDILELRYFFYGILYFLIAFQLMVIIEVVKKKTLVYKVLSYLKSKLTDSGDH